MVQLGIMELNKNEQSKMSASIKNEKCNWSMILPSNKSQGENSTLKLVGI